jgi:hypothetical protein
MREILSQVFTSLSLTEAHEFGGLRVHGVRAPCGNGLKYRTLDEAMRAKTFEVLETHEQGSVPVLKVKNLGDLPVFLISGEELIGAKQNRIINLSMLVPAKTELPIPVSCVEAGRWAYRTAQFDSPGTMSHALLRKIKTKGVTEGYRRGGKFAVSNQGEVWNEVARKLQALGSCSPSAELHQAYEDRAAGLEEFRKNMTAPADCNGVVFTVHGRLVGADIFDKAETLQACWPKLVRGFALDALEPSPASTSASSEEVAAWLRAAADAQVQAFKSPGMGEDVRIVGPRLTGAGLVVDRQPIHIELFVDDAAPAKPQT